MTKESNLFITFLKSFSSYIVFTLVLGLGNAILAKAGYLKYCTELISGLIFVVLVYSVYRKKIKKDFKNFKKDFKENWLKVLLVSGGLILLEIVVYQLLLHFGITSNNQDVAIQEINGSTIPLIIYFIFIGTIVEESCFRLPYSYCNSNKLVTYIFYSVVFASIHLLLSTSLLELLYVIPYLALSFGIGYGFYKTDNILMSTMVHIINNFLGIMLILL